MVKRLRAGDHVVDADGVIFDKDGTLVEFAHVWQKLSRMRQRYMVEEGGVSIEAARRVLETTGIDPDTGRIHCRSPLVMASVEEEVIIAAGVLFQYGYSWDDARSLAEAAFEAAEKSVTLEDRSRAVNGMETTLQHLRECGLKLAVATVDGAMQTRRVLESLGIRDLFATVVSVHDVTRAKPDPETVYLISRRLHIQPERLVMVGDSVSDVRMGKEAGVALSVGILNGVTDPDLLGDWADVVISSLSEISVQDGVTS